MTARKTTDMTQRRAASVGMFDGFHRGHQFLIDFLGRHADGERPLLFTFPNHPLQLVRPADTPRLLTTPDEKRSLLEDTGADVVFLPFDHSLRTLTSRQFLEMIRDRYDVGRLIVGYNNHFGNDRDKNLADYQEIGRVIGVEVIGAPQFADVAVSSSAIRALIADGDVEAAAELLGRRYALSGLVVHGRRLGREIGFPTANIAVDASKLLPLSGVYAADAILPDGTVGRAVLNIGRRPTVETFGATTVEVHIDGFDGDLYGKPLTVALIGRLRDERRFDSLDALAAQLRLDLEQTRRL